ncbi:MAG TPA: DUF4340 domain-containing protein [Planctomycetota bacterium]|nr:DUF4340 domain-containing protein [Planctomycetota bacterium]
MRPRVNLVLLVVAVLLSVYVHFFERSAPPGQRLGKAFRDLAPRDIVEVEISRVALPGDQAAGVDARPIRLSFEGSPPGWWIVEPIRFEAFYPRVQSIVFDIADLVRVAEVPEGAGPFSEASPRIEARVRFKTRLGEERLIEIGPDHPDSQLDFCYVRVNKDVFVTRKDFRRNIHVTLDEVRSRALFPISVSDALEVSIRAAPGAEGAPALESTISRPDTSTPWRLRKPFDALADRELMESLLVDLNSWIAASFETDTAVKAADLAPYGLDLPRAVVTVRGIDKRESSLEIGGDVREKSPPHVYVRHAGQPFVFSAPAAPLERLRQGAEELRARYVFDIPFDEIEEVRAEVRGVSVSLRHVESGKDAREWQVTGPGAEGTTAADAPLVQGVLTTLRKLLILQFRAEGLGPIEGRLVLATRGGKSHEMLLGGRSPAPEDADTDNYRAAVPGEPGSYIVHFPYFDLFSGGPMAFRKRNISELDPAQVLEIEIIAGKRTWTLWRTPGEPWLLTVDSPILRGKELKPATVDQLLRALHRERFRVVRFAPEVKDLATQGLELSSPARAVVLRKFLEEPAGFRKLVLGTPAASGSVFGRVETDGVPPFLIEKEVSSLFDSLVEHLRDITGP